MIISVTDLEKKKDKYPGKINLYFSIQLKLQVESRNNCKIVSCVSNTERRQKEKSCKLSFLLTWKSYV